MELTEAIKILKEKRDDLLYTLNSRIELHLGTEEELIKELKAILKINRSLNLLKEGLETLPYVEKMISN